MANWTRREVVTRTVEYEVPAAAPWGANWNEVQQGLDKAVAEYEDTYGHMPADDAVRVRAKDESIVIIFVKPEA